MHEKRIIALFLFLIIISVSGFAYPLLANGSAETYSGDGNVLNGEVPNWHGSTITANIFSDINVNAPNGQRVFELTLINDGVRDPYAYLNYNYEISGGDLNFWYNKPDNTATHIQIYSKRIIDGKNTLLWETNTPSSGYVSVSLPNYDQNIYFVYYMQVAGNSKMWLDDIRLNAKPTLINYEGTPIFQRGIRSDQDYFYRIHYAYPETGMTCSVKDLNTNEIFSTNAWSSSEYYKNTESKSFSFPDINGRIYHDMNVYCSIPSGNKDNNGYQGAVSNFYKTGFEWKPLLANGSAETYSGDGNVLNGDVPNWSGTKYLNAKIMIDTNTDVKDSFHGFKFTLISSSSEPYATLNYNYEISGGNLTFWYNKYYNTTSTLYLKSVRLLDGTTTTLWSSNAVYDGNVSVSLPNYDQNIYFQYGISSSTATATLLLDNIRLYPESAILNVSTSSPVIVNQEMNFIASYLSQEDLSPISSGSCSVSFDTQIGQETHDMTFSADSNSFIYPYTYSSIGTFGYNISCSDSNFTTTTKYGSLDVLSEPPPLAFDTLTFTPIENIGSYDLNRDLNAITMNPSIELNQLIWRIDSNNDNSVDVNYLIYNSLNDGRQYFIYTSSTDSNFVFNDSLTYGSAYSNPIQKIWNQSLNKFVYSFKDTLTAGETKYYKLTYKLPVKAWENINSDWYVQLPASINDVNGKSTDVYSLSNYSNLRNELIEFLPDLTGETGQDVSFELQFTAWADTALNIQAGTNVNGVESLTSYAITTTPHRYSLTISSSDFDARLLFKTAETSLNTLYITDMALIDRGYFWKRLIVSKPSGDPLDSIILGGQSSQYLQEGSQFKVNSSAYDREGDLNYIKVEAFFYGVEDANKVKKEFEILTTASEKVFNFDELFDAVIDLNGTAYNPANPRTVFIKATLYDNLNQAVAEQSESYKFLQFPYFPSDIRINLIVNPSNVGEYPEGVLTMQTNYPDTILGFDLRIYDENHSVSNPNYSNKFFKDTDFSCNLFDCSLNFKIDDWLYPDENKFIISVLVLVTTENPDWSNYLLRRDAQSFIEFREYETLRLFQLLERQSWYYKNTEKIPLVLQLRDSSRENLYNELDINMRIVRSENAVPPFGDPTYLEGNYYPDKFLFDPIGNYNLWFFNPIFSEEEYPLLFDGNNYRIVVYITDKKSKHSNIVVVPLTSKCKNLDYGIDFWGWEINLLDAPYTTNIGICNTEQERIITNNINEDQEHAITINNAYVPASPEYKSFYCNNPTNFDKILDTETTTTQNAFSCVSVYDFNEVLPDSFKYRIGNFYSDFTETDSKFKQYLDIEVPYPLIIYSDTRLIDILLRQGDLNITSIGDALRYSINLNLGIPFNFFNILNDPLNYFSAIDDNLSFFQESISTNEFKSAFSFKIENTPFINAYDYKKREGFGLNPAPNLFKKLFYLNELPAYSPAVFTLYVGNNPVYTNNIDGAIVINEKGTEIKTVIGEDGNITTFKTPVKLQLSSILFYNNKLSAIDKYTEFYFDMVVRDKFDLDDILAWFDDLINDPINTITDTMFKNILFISVILAIILIVSVIYFNFFGGSR